MGGTQNTAPLLIAYAALLTTPAPTPACGRRRRHRGWPVAKREARGHRFDATQFTAPVGAEDHALPPLPARLSNNDLRIPVAARFALATGYPLWRLRRARMCP